MSFPRKTKNVLRSVFLTVHMLLTVQCVSESTSISSFFIKSWDTGTTSWVRAVDIFPREDVRLECTTTEFSQVNELHITRADGFSLSKDHTIDIQKDSQSLVVILKSVECSQMGTYLCKNGRGDKKTVDLGIYDCPPRPCKNQSTNITLYARVTMTRQFSVCVEAFSFVSSLFFFNGIELRFNRSNEFPGVICALSKVKELFSTYNISCTITVSSDKNYTVHDFSIPNGMAQTQKVSFAVRIGKPVPLECPTDIHTTNQGRNNSITLSWKPVNNIGGTIPANYTIFYTINDTEWKRYNTVEDTQVTITGLKTYVLYEFRVASANEYSLEIDENTCNHTIVVNTTKEPKSTTTFTTITTPTTTTITSTTQNVTEVLKPIVIAVIVLAIIVVVAVVVGIFVCFKLRKLHSGISRAASLATISYHSNQRALPAPRGEYASVRRTEDDERGATSSGQGPVRHVSPEGLTYVTIDHSKTRPKRGKRKSEKVTYATLDLINTGKYTVPEIPSDTEYGNIRVT